MKVSPAGWSAAPQGPLPLAFLQVRPCWCLSQSSVCMPPGTRPSLSPSSRYQEAVWLPWFFLQSLLFFLGAPWCSCRYAYGQKRKTGGRALVFIRPFLWSGTIGILNISSRLLSLFCRQLPKVMELMSRRVRLQPMPAASRICPSEGGVAREHS